MKFLCPSVLIYHKFSVENDRNKYIISADGFKAHLVEIQTLHLKPITVDRLPRIIEDRAEKPYNYILLTFDDGNSSDYYIAFSFLAACNFVATFFITTDWIGLDGYMTSSQIRELSLSGMSIQSHSKSHSFLDEMTEKELYVELRQSKVILEDILDKEVTCLSIPGGRLNEKVIDCASKLGYKAIFTSIPFQYIQVGGITLVGRIGLRNPLTINQYRKLLKPSFSTITHLKTKQFVKNWLKSFLGGRLYYSLWRITIKK